MNAASFLRDTADRLDAVARLDPEQQAVELIDLYESVRTIGLPAIADQRRSAVRALYAQGVTMADLADMLGLSQSRVSRILAN